MSAPPFRNFVDIARQRAADEPDEVGFYFREPGGRRHALTYRELDRRARAVATELRARAGPGERVLVLEPPGLGFVTSLLACAYADQVAVPTYPPLRTRAARTLERLQQVAHDSAALLALVDSHSGTADMLQESGAAHRLTLDVILTDTVPDAAADSWRPWAADPDRLALLQYTSGATGTPKGVMLTDGNLLHNSALIREVFGHDRNSRGVIWLPPYHDMGLIGGILQPLFAGFPVTLMTPHQFLQHPIEWLRAISEVGATTSGGPSFAYDLCVRRVAAEERRGLDLSSWTVAFNGAEPVNPGTLDQFCAAFADAGFRREAFLPCYGLAEATLMVSGGPRGIAPQVRVLKPIGAEPDNARALPGARVAVGRPAGDLIVLITDPASGDRCPPGRIGEIRVAGSSVARGYFGRPAETSETFVNAQEGEHPGRFVRTGDLGLLADGMLFVTGRLKDVIIVAGRNHHPEDLERSAQTSHDDFVAGGGAAFPVSSAAGEQVILLQEVQRAALRRDPEELFRAIRAALSHDHQLTAHTIGLLRPGEVPRTLSGKVQRRQCQQLFLDGALQPWARWSRAPREQETSHAQIS